ncbi:MAG TPA: metal-binding protein [Leptolyngbyaceae cyanobacterium M33_DOE_097]|uniref:Metal-binding protein n=1 Tax=Oscillatoriales cyanobacterium SpSt-418 TaxID=2282169 RepID=A0A7C3KJL6_9CYAN|nr:metal-binding protein [Leptolyngbyaceae cyanobacterium M33_DOE_097]
MAPNESGRLVWNHSTHLEGLIPILEKLTRYEGIQTITPGVLARVRAHSPKLIIKVSLPIRGGYKLIARRGKTVQEVFIVTQLSPSELETAIAQAMS